MPEHLHGDLNAKGLSAAIVVGRFNELICRNLVEGALDCLHRHGAADDDMRVIWVPGAFEIPLACQAAARTGKYQAVIALGAVIRGSTAHFDFVAGNAASGISRVMLESGVPVSFGIITPDTIDQALERAGTKAGNKGWDAALSAIEMVNVLKQL